MTHNDIDLASKFHGATITEMPGKMVIFVGIVEFRVSSTIKCLRCLLNFKKKDSRILLVSIGWLWCTDEMGCEKQFLSRVRCVLKACTIWNELMGPHWWIVEKYSYTGAVALSSHDHPITILKVQSCSPFICEKGVRPHAHPRNTYHFVLLFNSTASFLHRIAMLIEDMLLGIYVKSWQIVATLLAFYNIYAAQTTGTHAHPAHLL